MYKSSLLCILIVSVLCEGKTEKVFHYNKENFDSEKQNVPFRTSEDEWDSKRLSNDLTNNFIEETRSNHLYEAEGNDDTHSIAGHAKSSILIIDVIDKTPPMAKSSGFNINKNSINDNNSVNLLKRVLNKIRNPSEESDERITNTPSPHHRDSFDRMPPHAAVNRNSKEESDERITKSYGQQENSNSRTTLTSFTNRKPYEAADENINKPFSARKNNSHSATIGNSNEDSGERTTKSPSSQRRDSFDKKPVYSVANRESKEESDEKITNSYGEQKHSTVRTPPPYPSTARIPPPSFIDSASGKSTLRVCEIKYAEYIQRIFPQELDTARDANDEEFNGRVLAAPGEYPHMSALGFRSSNGKLDYKCGGSLISENFVITAAHCTSFTGLAPSKVRIGDLNLMVEENYLEPQIRDIKRIYVHPDYKATSYYNDIALLELATEVRLTEFVRPIRLWTQETLPFTTAYAMGYGSTEFAREQTNRLTNLNMTIVPNDECNREMPKLPQTEKGILPSQICARDYALNRDTCQGDSGGPLQLNIRGRRSQNRLHYQLIGITSYGLHCRSGYPSIFTRVCYYLDWIERIVWKDYFN